MKVCNKCGQSIPDESKFCSFCGEVCEISQDTVSTEDVQVYDTTVMTVEEPVSKDSTQTDTPNTSSREEEQKHLDSLYNRLKWERIAWKIPGIILLVCSIIILICSVIIGAVGIYSTTQSVMTDEYYYEYYDGEGYYYDNNDSSTIDGADVAIGVTTGVFAGIYTVLGVMFLAIAIVNLVMAKKVGNYRNKLYTDCTDAVKHSTSVGSIVMGAIFNEYALIAIIINFILTKKNRGIFERIKANQTAYNTQVSDNK